MSTAFLLCVERGPLEAQAILCVESLREWGEAMADTPVHTFAPRSGHEPERATLDRLADLGAHQVDAPLNTAHPELPHTNKVYVSAWAERELDHEVLVFVDSDTFFLREPSLLAPGDWVAAARAVGQANAGSTGPGHRNDQAWLALYDELGVSARPFLKSNVAAERIRAYFNAGLLAVRRDSGLLGAWADAVDHLLGSGFVERWSDGRSQLRNQVDQLALAGVVADHFDHLFLLPETYNYPLPKRVLQPAGGPELGIDDLVHVHGHVWLHVPGFLEQLHPPLDSGSARHRWLAERLPLEPVVHDPGRDAKFPAILDSYTPTGYSPSHGDEDSGIR